jgi:hypothetical protein
MTIADGLKKTLYRARALSGRFGLRPYRVLFVKRAYTGTHTGDGARLEEWTPITHADGQPVNVRFSRIEERALGNLPDGVMGQHQNGVITISPKAMQSDADLIHTMAHELGHAATRDNGNSLNEEKSVDALGQRIQQRIAPGKTYELDIGGYKGLAQDNGTRAERSPVFSTCNMTSLRVLSWLSRKRISNCEAQSMASIRISTQTA